MRTRRQLAAALVCSLLIAGCGKEAGVPNQPLVGVKGSEKKAAQGLGFPTFATKNTTRVGGADAVADAAAVARAVFPAETASTRPSAVTLVDGGDWRIALASAVLMAAPVRAPMLFSNGASLPPASEAALEGLGPRGARSLAGTQVIRVGSVARPAGFKTTDIKGGDPFTVANEVDRLIASARGGPSGSVVVVSADEPAFAMPAAGWAAKSGNPILFVKRDLIPPATRAALRRHDKPRIYVLGPGKAVSGKVLTQLRRLGAVKRIEGADPVRNAIAFAHYADSAFGWGVVDPGHGLVFANAGEPLVAAAAAPLSASGTYGPLLLVDDPKTLPRPLIGYLLNLQPGYRKDPVRGVYNHGWLIGDERAISAGTQARLDSILEIAPIDRTNTA
jgi:hypothetical protein